MYGYKYIKQLISVSVWSDHNSQTSGAMYLKIWLRNSVELCEWSWLGWLGWLLQGKVEAKLCSQAGMYYIRDLTLLLKNVRIIKNLHD